MDILFYIKELLKTNNTINIVGLGTLYKKKIPGRYDTDQHVFLPPSLNVSFTNKYNEDNDLANYIAQAENVDLANAKLKIIDFVENIKSTLTHQNEAKLAGLGSLRHIDNELKFQADQENDFKNEFFGLPSLNELVDYQKELSDKEKQKNEDDKVSDEVFLTSTSDDQIKHSNLESKIPIIESPPYAFEDDDEDENERSSSSKFLIRFLLFLVLIAAVVGLTYYLKPRLFDNILKNENPDIINAEVVLPIDTIPIKTDSLVNDTIPKLDSMVVLTKQVETTKSNSITYEVIGSAEKSEKRIVQFIKTMKKRGIEAKALENAPGKLIKISLGSFTDYNLAKKHQDSLRIKLNNPEIYIQTIKPKK